MSVCGVLLGPCVVALCLAADPTMHSADTTQRSYAAYAKLDSPGREQWLRTLLRRRIEPAAGRVLTADELRLRREYDAQILAYAAAGRTLSPGGVASLLADLDRFELAAIGELERRMRIATYERYRTQRSDYDRRVLAMRDVHRNWETAGSRADDRPTLIAWLEASLAANDSPAFAALAREPKFGQVEPPSAPAQPLAKEPQVTSKPPTEPTAKSPPVATRSEAVASAPHQPTVSAAKIDQPHPTANPSPNTARNIGPQLTSEPSRAAPLFERAQIDADELAARVAGHNLALAQLEELASAEATCTAEQLADAVTQLEDLATRRADLQLYVTLVEAESLPSQLGSPDTAVAALAGQIARLRATLQSQPYDEASRELLVELASLSVRLAKLHP